MKTNTIEKKFANEPTKLEIVPCYACDGQGYFMTSNTPRELVLCDCIKDLCSSCGDVDKKYRKKYNPEMNTQQDCKCMNPVVKFNRIKKLYEKANIPDKYRLAKYEDIDDTNDNTSSLFAAKDTIREFLETSPVTNQIQPLGFYMYGGTGCGKTHLAVSILNVMILKYGVESRYCKFSRDFLTAIKDTFNKKNTWGDPDTESAKKIEDDLQKVPVLVLDDFGVTKESDWANEKTYDLLTTRLEANRITIITSNIDWDNFKGVFENRIYSRLCEMCRPLMFLNKDYREAHKEKC